jgi:type IV pilus assembly protein PilW
MNKEHNAGGSTLIELMLALSLSLFVVLAALAVLQAANEDFILQEQSAQLEENGRYALELVSRALQQTAYAGTDAVLLASDRISGADNSNVVVNAEGIDTLTASSLNGSDVLAVRFAGAGAGTVADGSIINCAGFAISENSEQGWSIFHVAKNAGGEMELRCKYRGNLEWDSQAIVPGVESFQVLYGIDTDGDGIANQYLNATRINWLDSTEKTSEAASYWGKVVVVRIALLLVGSRSLNHFKGADHYDLFGQTYADDYAGLDGGSRILLRDLPAVSRKRLRRVVESVVYLHPPIPTTSKQNDDKAGHHGQAG